MCGASTVNGHVASRAHESHKAPSSMSMQWVQERAISPFPWFILYKLPLWTGPGAQTSVSCRTSATLSQFCLFPGYADRFLPDWKGVGGVLLSQSPSLGLHMLSAMTAFCGVLPRSGVVCPHSLLLTWLARRCSTAPAAPALTCSHSGSLARLLVSLL